MGKLDFVTNNNSAEVGYIYVAQSSFLLEGEAKGETKEVSIERGDELHIVSEGKEKISVVLNNDSRSIVRVKKIDFGVLDVSQGVEVSEFKKQNADLISEIDKDSSTVEQILRG